MTFLLKFVIVDILVKTYNNCSNLGIGFAEVLCDEER